MLTALLIALLLLPIFLLWDKSKRISNKKLIDDIKSTKGKIDLALEKKIRDEFNAELAPILDIVDPNANVGLVVKELRDKYEPGVWHDIVAERATSKIQRLINYEAVFQYSWYKHNIRDIQFKIWLYNNYLFNGKENEFETPEEVISNLKERNIKVPTKLIKEACSDIENKHEWFMDKYKKKSRDNWLSLYGDQGSEDSNIEPLLFFAGEEIYEVVPTNRMEISNVSMPCGITTQVQKLSREEFAAFLVDHPDVWCRIKKVTEFFEDCPLLPPLLPKRMMRKYRTLRERIRDSGGKLSEELSKVYHCTVGEKLKSYGVDTSPRIIDLKPNCFDKKIVSQK